MGYPITQASPPKGEGREAMGQGERGDPRKSLQIQGLLSFPVGAQVYPPRRSGVLINPASYFYSP